MHSFDREKPAKRDSQAAEAILHPFTKREVSNLTAEMAMEHFGAMQSVKWRRDDGEWIRLRQKMTVVALQILAYLRVPESVFWVPPKPKLNVRVI